jgi:hypothetical protein
VPNSDRSLEELASLFEAMVGDARLSGDKAVSVNVSRFAAELAARLPTGEPSASLDTDMNDQVAMLAAYLDGGLDDSARQWVEALLAASPAELQNAIASLVHLENIARVRSAAPDDLVDAAIARWKESPEGAKRVADIIPLRGAGRDKGRGREASAPVFDSFLPLAAASGADHGAILCRSQSGLWTLEIFVGKSGHDRSAEQGYLLLAVHSDHRSTYEGRNVRVFVKIGDEERVLAEEIVRNGEIYAAISLAGLDLWVRDAINVVFGPQEETP